MMRKSISNYMYITFGKWSQTNSKYILWFKINCLFLKFWLGILVINIIIMKFMTFNECYYCVYSYIYVYDRYVIFRYNSKLTNFYFFLFIRHSINFFRLPLSYEWRLDWLIFHWLIFWFNFDVDYTLWY